MPLELKQLKWNSVAELNAKVHVDLKSNNVRLKCKSTQAIIQKAKEFRREGNEEMAYIYYMRFGDVFQQVKNDPEFMKEKRYYEDLIGVRNLMSAIEEAEKLEKSLTRRYRRASEAKEWEKQHQEEEEAARLFLEKENNRSENHENDHEFGNHAILDDSILGESIRPIQLYKLMDEKNFSFLIIDTRPADDYEESHMLYPNCINIPESIIPPGITAATLEKQLVCTSSRSVIVQWKDRGSRNYIVLMDWKSNFTDVTKNNVLHHLKEALTSWDRNTCLMHPPLILDGGYSNWLQHYPANTTKAIIIPKENFNNDLDEITLDFVYPTWDDINDSAPETLTSDVPMYDRTRKPRSGSVYLIDSDDDVVLELEKEITKLPQKSKGRNRPMVDRNLKPRIENDTVTASKQMEEIYAKEKNLVNENLNLEQQVLDKERAFDMLQLKKEKEAEMDMRLELQKKEEELLECIQQLQIEKKKKDEEKVKLEVENKEIKQYLEDVVKENKTVYMRFEQEREQMKRKEAERRKLERETERLRQERKTKEAQSKMLQEERTKEKEVVPSKTAPHIDYVGNRSSSVSHDPSIKYEKIKDDDDSNKNATSPTQRSNLSRSHSSPNIAQLLEEEQKESFKSVPQFDRTAKPLITNERRMSFMSQLQSEEHSAVRLRNLMPFYGNTDVRALTGLRNLGNTCFMNSTIQCLAQTTLLATYFVTGKYFQDLNRANPLGHRGELAYEFALVIKALWAGQYRYITPKDFKNTVSKFQPMFEGNDQQDSQEFLVFLMDGLHEDLNLVTNRQREQIQTPINTDKLTDEEAAELEWKKYKRLNESYIVSLFQGQYKSTVKCLYCEKTSVKFDAFMYLSVPIPTNYNKCTLMDCLQLFMKEEKMTGESKWLCPKCQQPREALKSILIWKLPPVLLIHLKRFSYEGMWRRKLQTFIDFPLIDLKLPQLMMGTKSPPKTYSLYAVSNHYGTMEGGHYTAYSKNGENNRWYKFDDQDVYEMGSSDVVTSAAYMLFYTSVDRQVPLVQD